MKIKIWVYTGHVGSKVEKEIDIEDDLGIDIEDWKEYEEGARAEVLKDFIEDSSMFEWGYEEIK